jgi:hypothetical protein
MSAPTTRFPQLSAYYNLFLTKYNEFHKEAAPIASHCYTRAKNEATEIVRSCYSQITNEPAAIARGAFAGLVAGYVFSIVSPVGGAIFGATYVISKIARSNITGRFNASVHRGGAIDTGLKMAGIAFSAGVTTALSSPVTFVGGAGLAIAMKFFANAYEEGSLAYQKHYKSSQKVGQ